jgi:hypothetical protein
MTMVSACSDGYYLSDDYDDMVCDQSGCFFCDQGICSEYRCDAEHQCPMGRICTVDQRCLPGDASTGTSSSETSNPRPQDEQTLGEGATNTPVTDDQSLPCEAHTDCDPGQICTSDGECVRSPGGGPGQVNDPDTEESAEIDTPESESTEEGSESDPTETSTGSGNDQEESSSEDEADPTLPEHPGDVCVVNADCGSDGMCLDAGCYFPCSDVGSCPSKQFCQAGQCLPLTQPENTCTFNGECGPAHICLDGTCFETCEEPLNCGPHETCEANLCVADLSPVIECSGGTSCEAGASCFNGKCLNICSDEISCDGDFDCQFGYCHQVVSCFTNEDCSDTLVCLDGDCQEGL